MVEVNWDNDRILFTPTNLYMEYILLSYNSYLKENLKGVSITIGELTYIYNIKYVKSISQRELADLLFVSEANVAKMLKKLEIKDLIRREKDMDNKSKNIVTLTENGEDVFLKVHLLTLQWERDITKNISNDNLVKFKETLYVLSQNSVDL